MNFRLKVLILLAIFQAFFILVCSGSGCIFLRDDQSIRCQNASLLEVGESLHILTMVVQNRPQTIDVDDCRGARQLPPIFNGVSNVSIDTVRVRRSGLRSLHADVFLPVASTLRDLDLSHNALRAVPQAVGVLWSLEHLNLQHNQIVFLRPTGLFDGLPLLRELNLAHNFIGQAKEGTDDQAQQQGYTLKANLKLDDFSLGQAIRSLESLNLRGNRLATIPQQVSGYSLPELRHLDLSENVIGKVDELSSALLPRLEFLDFQANRIQGIPFYSLPITLKYLDLTENPFHCDCLALWVYDWFFTNTTTIRLPRCNSPETLREIRLDNVPWEELCPEDNSTTVPFRYRSKGFRDYDVIQLVGSAKSVTVSWKVQDPRLISGIGDRKWAVVYRKASDSPYQMTLVPSLQPVTRETVLTQRISNLQSATQYVVCVALVQSGKYTIEPNKCQKVTTKKLQNDERENALEQSAPSLSGGNIQTQLDDMAAAATSITLRWQLRVLQPYLTDDESIRHEWSIQIRRTGQADNFTDIPVFDITSASETHGQLYEYGVGDLAPRTLYDVCLVDVEHRPVGDRMTAAPADTLDTFQARANRTQSCRTVQTSSNSLLYATEIAAIAVACAICFVVSGVTLFLCRQKKLLRWKPQKIKRLFCKGPEERPQPIGCNKFASTSIPRVNYEPRLSQKTLQRNFLESWNSVRLPYTDFSHADRPEFRSFRTPGGYKDALTSVTIYKSGYSEC